MPKENRPNEHLRQLAEAVNCLRQVFPAQAEDQVLRSTVFVQGTNQRAVDPRDTVSTKSRHNILNTAASSAFKTTYPGIQAKDELAPYLIPPILNLHGPHSGFRSEAFYSRKQAGELIGFNSEITFKEYFSEILLHLLRDRVKKNYALKLDQADTLEEQRRLHEALQEHFKEISDLLACTLSYLWKLYCEEKADLKRGQYTPENSQFIRGLKQLGTTLLGETQPLELHMAGFSRGGAIAVFSANLFDWMFGERCSTYLTLLDPATGPKKDKLLHHRLAPSIKKTSLFIAEAERLPIWQIGQKIKSTPSQLIESLQADCQHNDINVIRSNHKTRSNSKIMVPLAIQTLEKNLAHVLKPGQMALSYTNKQGRKINLNYSTDRILKRALSQTLPFEKRFFKKNCFFKGPENCLLRKTFCELYPGIYAHILFIERGERLFSEGWASTLAEALETLPSDFQALDQKSALIIREKAAHFFVDHLFKTQSLSQKKDLHTLETTLKIFSSNQEKFSGSLETLAKTHGKPLSLEGEDLKLYLSHQKLFKNLRTFVHFRHEYATTLYAALRNPTEPLDQPLLTKAWKQLEKARHLNISAQKLKAVLKSNPAPLSRPSSSPGFFSPSSKVFQEAPRETSRLALPYV